VAAKNHGCGRNLEEQYPRQGPASLPSSLARSSPCPVLSGLMMMRACCRSATLRSTRRVCFPFGCPSNSRPALHHTFSTNMSRPPPSPPFPSILPPQHFVLPVTATSLGILGEVSLVFGPQFNGTAAAFLNRGHVASAACNIGLC